MMYILAFFQRFSLWFKVLLIELMNNLIGLLFVLSLYLALWHFPQTIDLLLILNQADAFIFEVPLYFGLLLVSAFLIWNVPKYFYYHNHKDITFYNLIGFIPNQHYRFQNKAEDVKYPYLLRIHMRKTIPRILGTLLLIISALGILNAMELFEVENIYTEILNPSNTLVICFLFLIMLTEPRLYYYIQNGFNRYSWRGTFVIIVSIILLIFILLLGSLNTQAEEDLKKLFLSNCALAMLFFTISFNSYTFLKRIPRTLFYGIILVLGFMLLIVFVVLNIEPKISAGMNPLSVLMVCLSSLFMISFILILLGKKIRLPLFSMVFLLSVFSASYFSVNSNHYELSLQSTVVERYDIDQYIYHWIASRQNEIKKSEGFFPVIIVSAEGGGSRAGLWSFLIHSYLYEKSEGRYFNEHLLSLTGASGGSVGNAMFFSKANNLNYNFKKSTFVLPPNTGGYPIKYKASAIYKENFLSEALLSLLGRDLFKEITNLFTFKNRGQLLEDQWSKAHKKYFSERDKKSLLEEEFLSFYKDVVFDSSSMRKIPPLLFINTTHTQTGNYNLISPVRYKHKPQLKGMSDFIDNLQADRPDTSIALSTAMRINASFPYVTPVGEIKRVESQKYNVSDQYADAGYYDNMGGRVSKGIEEILEEVIKDSFPNLNKKIKVVHLVIANSKKEKRIKTQNQFTAPLTTLQNVRSGHTREVIEKLENKILIELKATPVKPYDITLASEDNSGLYIKPVLPLGRYLSTVAIQSMEARLKEVSNRLDSILRIN